MDTTLNISQDLMEDLRRALTIGCEGHINENGAAQFFEDLGIAASAQTVGKPIPQSSLSKLDLGRDLIDFAIARFQKTIDKEQEALKQSFFDPSIGQMISTATPELDGLVLQLETNSESDAFNFYYTEDTDSIPEIGGLGIAIDTNSDTVSFSDKTQSELAKEAIDRLNNLKDSIPVMDELEYKPDSIEHLDA